MRELLDSLLDREIVMPVTRRHVRRQTALERACRRRISPEFCDSVFGGVSRETHTEHTFRVRPPTVREGFTILAAIKALTDRDDHAWDLLEKTCRAWLPRGLCEVYFGPESFPPATLEDVRELVVSGIDKRSGSDEESNDKKSLDKVESEAALRSWTAVLADYADVLSTPVAELLEMPFPLFISLAEEVFRVQERRKADFMIAYIAARTGENLSKAILKGAGYLQSSNLTPPSYPKEFIEEQKAKARAYRERYGRRIGGKPGSSTGEAMA